MTNSWQVYRLRELLTQNFNAVKVLPDKSYKLLGVRLEGRGAFLREEKNGDSISAIMLNPVNEGDFIYSRLFAWRGAFGIVPKELDGCFVSGEFPTFKINKMQLLSKFLQLYFARSVIWEEVEKYCTGTTKASRNRFKEQFFLNLEISIPSLDEQHRIVECIEALGTRIGNVQSLRDQIIQESELLLRSILVDKSSGEPIPTPMKELVKLRDPDVIVDPNETYHFAGVYSFGRGSFRGIQRKGNQFAYPKLTRLHKNDFTYPKLMAWEGAYAIVPPECDGLVVSTEFPVFELNQEKILPETMAVYFRNPGIWETLSERSTGTNVRRRRLNPQTFLDYEFPLPSMRQQLILSNVQARFSPVRKLLAETQMELDALLPSMLDRAFKGEL